MRRFTVKPVMASTQSADFTFDEIKELGYKFMEYLDKNGLGYMEGCGTLDHGDPMIWVDVSGDWKHEHGAVDYLMQQFAAENNVHVQHQTSIPVDDGFYDGMSDSYHAEHHYYIAKGPEIQIEESTGTCNMGAACSVESSTHSRIVYLNRRIEELNAMLEKLDHNSDEYVDKVLELQELQEQLNFAWQDDEAEYNYALEQQEFNPDGSLKYYDDQDIESCDSREGAIFAADNSETQDGWVVYATDKETGEEFVAGIYQTESYARYWAAMDGMSDSEYHYGDYKYRVEYCDNITPDMWRNNTKFTSHKLANHDKWNQQQQIASSTDVFADDNKHSYTIFFGDGNSAASRGTEEEHDCEVSGTLPDDDWAYAAAFFARRLDDGFDWTDVYDCAVDWCGEDEADELIATGKSLLNDLDITGGDPLIYKIQKDVDNVIYYDPELEEEVKGGYDF